MTSSTCRFCAAEYRQTLIDFGPQPLTNRYRTAAGTAEFTFPFVLAQCRACGIVQLATVPDADELRSRFPWIVYNEPEGHLDDVAARIGHLPAVGSRSLIIGLSYKDDTTLARLGRSGLGNTRRVDLAADLGGDDEGAGLETLQDRFTPRAAADLAGKHGRADVAIARHVLEHAQDPAAFLAALRHLVAPGGHVVFEVPDCTRGLDLCDYSMPWEEHVAYFTPTTLRGTLEEHGFTVVDLVVYPASHENSLVAICRVGDPARRRRSSRDGVPAELDRGDRYARRFAARRDAYRGWLDRQGEKAALFGAGHLSATFVNLLGLADRFDCVIDDNPRKQGLSMPGSGLPIVSSAVLAEPARSLCLLSVRPEIEEVVRDKHRDFARRGGRMLSIFPGNPHPIPLDAAP